MTLAGSIFSVPGEPCSEREYSESVGATQMEKRQGNMLLSKETILTERCDLLSWFSYCVYMQLCIAKS